jgi:prophage DNA circulation protein
MAAVVIYGLTIAIGWDQLSHLSADKQKFEKDLTTAQGEVRATKASLKIAQADAVDWRNKAVGLSENVKAMIDAQKTLDAIKEQEIALLKAKASDQTYASTASAVPDYRPGQGSGGFQNTRISPAPIIPAWVPPAPSVVTKTIRDKAVAEYKDNYSSLNYEIERQTESFEKIMRYYKTADPFIKSAINKAALEHGTNYSSFAYDVERQIEARQKFDKR